MLRGPPMPRGPPMCRKSRSSRRTSASRATKGTRTTNPRRTTKAPRTINATLATPARRATTAPRSGSWCGTTSRVAAGRSRQLGRGRRMGRSPAAIMPRIPGGAVAAAASAPLAPMFMLAAAVAVVGGASLGPGGSGVAEGRVTASCHSRGATSLRVPAAVSGGAQRYGLDWAILAGIGKVECDHGRDPDPSCTREGAVNSAGAGGPMQFLASTWATLRRRRRRRRAADRWDPADAIYAAANYLRASGAPGDYRAAIFAYNHAGWYVAEVERWAARYRGAGRRRAHRAAAARRRKASKAPTRAWRREPDAGAIRRRANARCSRPGDGHLALVPDGRARDRAGDGGRGQRAAGPALRPRRPSRPAGRVRRGLLEHRQLRALSLRGAPDRRNRAATTRWPRTTCTGARPGPGDG